ncbi:MAG: response regulator, partial [Pseudomonadota bacterium]
MKLLLADDHEMVRDTLAAFLEREGNVTVTQVADLDAACSEIETGPLFDLVLLDYSMPGMDRLNGLKRAIALRDGRPVAIMSGIAPKAIAQEALDLGAVGFLPKTMG